MANIDSVLTRLVPSRIPFANLEPQHKAHMFWVLFRERHNSGRKCAFVFTDVVNDHDVFMALMTSLTTEPTPADNRLRGHIRTAPIFIAGFHHAHRPRNANDHVEFLKSPAVRGMPGIAVKHTVIDFSVAAHLRTVQMGHPMYTVFVHRDMGNHVDALARLLKGPTVLHGHSRTYSAIIGVPEGLPMVLGTLADLGPNFNGVAATFENDDVADIVISLSSLADMYNRALAEYNAQHPLVPQAAPDAIVNNLANSMAPANIDDNVANRNDRGRNNAAYSRDVSMDRGRDSSSNSGEAMDATSSSVKRKRQTSVDSSANGNGRTPAKASRVDSSEARTPADSPRASSSRTPAESHRASSSRPRSPSSSRGPCSSSGGTRGVHKDKSTQMRFHNREVPSKFPKPFGDSSAPSSPAPKSPGKRAPKSPHTPKTPKNFQLSLMPFPVIPPHRPLPGVGHYSPREGAITPIVIGEVADWLASETLGYPGYANPLTSDALETGLPMHERTRLTAAAFGADLARLKAADVVVINGPRLSGKTLVTPWLAVKLSELKRADFGPPGVSASDPESAYIGQPAMLSFKTVYVVHNHTAGVSLRAKLDQEYNAFKAHVYTSPAAMPLPETQIKASERQQLDHTPLLAGVAVGHNGSHVVGNTLHAVIVDHKTAHALLMGGAYVGTIVFESVECFDTSPSLSPLLAYVISDMHRTSTAGDQSRRFGRVFIIANSDDAASESTGPIRAFLDDVRANYCRVEYLDLGAPPVTPRVIRCALPTPNSGMLQSRTQALAADGWLHYPNPLNDTKTRCFPAAESALNIRQPGRRSDSDLVLMERGGRMNNMDPDCKVIKAYLEVAIRDALEESIRMSDIDNPANNGQDKRITDVLILVASQEQVSAVGRKVLDMVECNIANAAHRARNPPVLMKKPVWLGTKRGGKGDIMDADKAFDTSKHSFEWHYEPRITRANATRISSYVYDNGKCYRGVVHIATYESADVLEFSSNLRVVVMCSMHVARGAYASNGLITNTPVFVDKPMVYQIASRLGRNAGWDQAHRLIFVFAGTEWQLALSCERDNRLDRAVKALTVNDYMRQYGCPVALVGPKLIAFPAANEMQEDCRNMGAVTDVAGGGVEMTHETRALMSYLPTLDIRLARFLVLAIKMRLAKHAVALVAYELVRGRLSQQAGTERIASFAFPLNDVFKAAVKLIPHGIPVGDGEGWIPSTRSEPVAHAELWASFISACEAVGYWKPSGHSYIFLDFVSHGDRELWENVHPGNFWSGSFHREAAFNVSETFERLRAGMWHPPVPANAPPLAPVVDFTVLYKMFVKDEAREVFLVQLQKIQSACIQASLIATNHTFLDDAYNAYTVGASTRDFLSSRGADAFSGLLAMTMTNVAARFRHPRDPRDVAPTDVEMAERNVDAAASSSSTSVAPVRQEKVLPPMFNVSGLDRRAVYIHGYSVEETDRPLAMYMPSEAFCPLAFTDYITGDVHDRFHALVLYATAGQIACLGNVFGRFAVDNDTIRLYLTGSPVPGQKHMDFEVPNTDGNRTLLNSIVATRKHVKKSLNVALGSAGTRLQTDFDAFVEVIATAWAYLA